MVVIGIVLLAHQYQVCSKENLPICIFVIVMIIFRCMNLTGGIKLSRN